MGAAAPVGVDRFSTADLPPARRLAGWEAWNRTALIGLHAEPARRTALQATQVGRRVGRTRVARVRASAHEVRRTAHDVTRSPTGALALFLPLGAPGGFHAREDLPLSAGRLLVCDADRPFARTFPDGVDELVLTVPRRHRLAVPLLVDLTGGGVRQERAAALADLLVQVARGHADTAWRLLPLVDALVDPDAREPDRLELAHAVVAQRLADPSLSAATIAAALGVSERQLSRTFAAGGSTVPRHILDQRLQHAAVLLARGGTPTEVTRLVGLRSTSYLHRRFTERFGVTPGRWAADRPPAPH